MFRAFRVNILITVMLTFISVANHGYERKVLSRNGIFSGRISKLNLAANIIRIKVDFENIKYVNKRDRLEFWNPSSPSLQCKAYVAGRSSRYILLKVPAIEDCQKLINLGEGRYLHFFSKDLVNNLIMGRELIEILLKKRLAVNSKINNGQKELESHIEKVEAINLKFMTLRQKMSNQWSKELSDLEEDRIAMLRNYKGLEIRLDEIDHKLEKYRISDENLTTERWSLDPRLYYKK